MNDDFYNSEGDEREHMMRNPRKFTCPNCGLTEHVSVKVENGKTVLRCDTCNGRVDGG